jgi:hypothetical protein
MRITFLGTGTSQGVPLISCKCHVCTSSDERDKRLRSAISLRVGKQYIVIDSGPDFRQQMLRDEATHLDAIVSTMFVRLISLQENPFMSIAPSKLKRPYAENFIMLFLKINILAFLKLF